jgi:hypothetical protein
MLGLCAPTCAEPPADDRPSSRTAAAPPVVLQISRALLDPIVDRTIDETKPVVDVILGTPVRGTSRTIGQPTLTLVDHPDSVVFVVTLIGTSTSHTTGQNGPAIIRTRTDTAFAATKRVSFDPAKGFLAEPARVAARSRAINEGIEPTRRGALGVIGRAIERRASEQVAAQRPQIEAITQQRTSKHVAEAFDRTLNERLADLNRRAAIPERLAKYLGAGQQMTYRCYTHGGCVYVTASRGGPSGPVDLPQLREAAAPVQIWLHKSLVGDEFAGFLKRFDEIEVPALAVTALQTLSPAIRPELGLLTRHEAPPLDYATSEDWIVFQMRPGSDQPAPRAAAVAARAPSVVIGR